MYLYFGELMHMQMYDYHMLENDERLNMASKASFSSEKTWNLGNVRETKQLKSYGTVECRTIL